MNAPIRKVPAGSIQTQSRPKVADMTLKLWGPLTAVRRAGGPNWWFRHEGHHGDAEFLHDAQGVRFRAKRGLEIFCPLCKGSK